MSARGSEGRLRGSRGCAPALRGQCRRQPGSEQGSPRASPGPRQSLSLRPGAPRGRALSLAPPGRLPRPLHSRGGSGGATTRQRGGEPVRRVAFPAATRFVPRRACEQAPEPRARGLASGRCAPSGHGWLGEGQRSAGGGAAVASDDEPEECQCPASAQHEDVLFRQLLRALPRMLGAARHHR